MTINDMQLCEAMRVLRSNYRGIDELIAKGDTAQLREAFKKIELAAMVALDILGRPR